MKITLVIKLLLISTFLQAQDIEYTLFNSSNGFVDDLVSGLFVDSHNRLWIGTYNNGIFTYKDDAFTHYDENEYDLLTGRAKAFVEDSLGNIWVGFYDSSQGGVMMFDGNEFIPKHTPSDSISIGRVLDIEINELTNELLVYEAPNNYNAATINVIQEDSISVYTLGTTTNSIIDDGGDILVTNEGTIFVTGRFDGLFTLEEDSLMLFTATYDELLEGDYVGKYDLLQDQEGYIWINFQWEGLVIINEELSFWTVFHMIDNNYNDIGVLPGQRLWNFSQNTNGEVWFVTTDFVHPLYGNVSNMYVHTFRDGEMITIEVVNSQYIDEHQGVIAVDNSNIWVGVEGQLMRVAYEFEEEVTDSLPIYNEVAKPRKNYLYPNPADQHIYTLMEEESNYEIYDLYGQLLKSGSFLNRRINTTSLANGHYVIKILKDESQYVQPIIIQH